MPGCDVPDCPHSATVVCQNCAVMLCDDDSAGAGSTCPTCGAELQPL